MALGEIDRLWRADPATPEGERLEILLTLVDAYEEANHPIPPADPVDVIEFMMEQRAL
jgi:HTH-type transcriptional regulator / antitoxin HigA